jgi:hypothetical protein
MLWSEPDGLTPKSTEKKVVQRMSTPNHLTAVHEILGTLESDQYAKVIGDFCAKRNFMKKSYAKRLGLPIDRSTPLPVVIASGKTVLTAGSVKAHFRFRNEPTVYLLSFELLSGCVHDLILGKHFIKATRTFSSAFNHARRVFTRFTRKVARYSTLFLGDSAPKFTGLLNGRAHAALADSGCKVLLMDEAYAHSMGLPIVSGDQHRVKLIFADETTAMTSGMTFGVKWAFGTDGRAGEHSLNFHILKNAPAPVILSDDFLFATNAYSEFDRYLIDEDYDDDDDGEAYFLAIDIDLNYRGQGQYLSPYVLLDRTDNMTLVYDLRRWYVAPAEDVELIRRGEEDDHIAILPYAERGAARLAETQRRKEWDASHKNNLQVPSIAAAAQAIRSVQQDGSTQRPPKRRLRWLLKLKPRKDP